MNIAILGKGFIGTYLKTFLSDGKGHSICWLDQESDQYQVPGKLREIINSQSIDIVVNTSGYTGYPNVDGCEDNKAICTYLNITVPLIIEEECKSSNVKLIHVSSGCIYTGYEKNYTEIDAPNFGIYNPDSSFYSKTKHISEMFLDKEFTNILRIRMPITFKNERKNLLTKLLEYDNIIDFKNSKTDVFKLCELIEVICHNFVPGIFNAVHSNTLTTSEVIDIMSKNGLINENWKFVEYEDLNIKANRSNCILSNDKILKTFNFDFGDESYFISINSSIMSRDRK